MTEWSILALVHSCTHGFFWSISVKYCGFLLVFWFLLVSWYVTLSVSWWIAVVLLSRTSLSGKGLWYLRKPVVRTSSLSARTASSSLELCLCPVLWMTWSTTKSGVTTPHRWKVLLAKLFDCLFRMLLVVAEMFLAWHPAACCSALPRL